MAFSQMIMFGILLMIFGKPYFIPCIFIVGMQILGWLLYKFHNMLPIERFKFWLARDYMTEEEDNYVLE